MASKKSAHENLVIHSGGHLNVNNYRVDVIAALGGTPGAHLIQGRSFPDLRGSVLGEGVRFRPVDEIQESHERPGIRSEPDPQPTVYAVVEPDYQSRKCIRRFPGPT